MPRRTLPFLTLTITWWLSLVPAGWAQQDVQAATVDGAPGPIVAHAARAPDSHRLKRNYAHTPVALTITLPPITRAQQAASTETEEPERPGPLQIGFGRDMPDTDRGDLAPRLAWETQSDGSQVSALSVSSPGARAVRVALRGTLPTGAEVRFFSPADPEQRFPPVQPADVSPGLAAEAPAGAPAEESAPLWSPVVEGDTVGVEISLPSPAAVSDVALFIDRVSHLAASVRQATPQRRVDIGDAASCHIDVACRSTTPQNLARATAKTIHTDPDGMSFLCSGTLMVDSDDSSHIPYFLTANHCIDTQTVARSLNTYWGFERAYCGGPAPLDVNQLTGGADLLATDAGTDATLLRLRETPVGPTWYAGWSGAPLFHPAEVIGLHHPRGDLKKYSRGRSVRDTGHILQETGQSVSSVQVTWSEGTIERGSSGSGLFDTTGRLRGIASGGSINGTVCGFNRESFYGRFDLFYPQVTRWLVDTPDDHGGSRDRATSVAPNTETAGYLERAGDVDYFRVEVAEAGRLTVETSGTTDTFGYLQGARGQYLAGNDNAGEGNNFRIGRPVPAGTYHVAVVGATGRTATGAYTLAVRFVAAGETTEHGNSRDRATPVGLNTETAGALERAGDVDYFRFEVAQAGSLTVETTGATNTVGYLGGATGGWLSQDDDAGADGNFRIVRQVTAGTYYVAVVGATGRTATGAYTLAVRFTSGGGGGGRADDHGNTRGQATRVGLNTTVEGVLERRGDVDYFQLTVTRAGTLEVETSGTTDTFGYLGDATGRWLSRNDDTAGDVNFRIERQVTAGTYYVAIVGGAARTQTGAYTFGTVFTVASAPDDHGDTWERATGVGLNSSTAGSIEQADDVDYFRILVTEAGTLTVETSGTTDTYGSLWVPTDETWVQNDNAGVGTNFRIVEQVTAGRYFVAVRGYHEEALGPYTLRVRFTSTPSGGSGLRSLLGTWRFTYRIISTFTYAYRLSRVVTTTGTPLISGTDEYGDRIIAGRIQDIRPGTDLPYEYTLLDDGIIICRFYLFNKTGNNSVSGVQYTISNGDCSGSFFDPNPMTGRRVSLSTSSDSAVLQPQTAAVSRQREELQRAEAVRLLERKSASHPSQLDRGSDNPLADIVRALSSQLETLPET